MKLISNFIMNTYANHALKHYTTKTYDEMVNQNTKYNTRSI